MGQIFSTKMIVRIFDTDIDLSLTENQTYFKEKTNEIVNLLIEKNDTITIHLSNIHNLLQYIENNERRNFKKALIQVWLLSICLELSIKHHNELLLKNT